MTPGKRPNPRAIRLRQKQQLAAKKAKAKGPAPFPGSPPAGKPAGSGKDAAARRAAILARRGTPPVDNRKPVPMPVKPGGRKRVTAGGTPRPTVRGSGITSPKARRIVRRPR